MNHSYFQLIGKRLRQEDAYFISKDRHLFAVCDGVGGSQDGRMAAQMLVESIGNKYAISDIQTMKDFKIFTEEIVNSLWQKTILNIATTMSLVYLSGTSAYIASIGDTKVYVIDPISKEWIMTRDHSIVQELYEAGIIHTEAEKRTHPMRHKITKAISSTSLLVTEDIEFKEIKTLTCGSYILLATDGVCESFDNEELIDIILDKQLISVQQKIAAIEEKCSRISKDNSTCVLIEYET